MVLGRKFGAHAVDGWRQAFILDCEGEGPYLCRNRISVGICCSDCDTIYSRQVSIGCQDSELAVSKIRGHSFGDTIYLSWYRRYISYGALGRGVDPCIPYDFH